jgi:hypothetical protein
MAIRRSLLIIIIPILLVVAFLLYHLFYAQSPVGTNNSDCSLRKLYNTLTGQHPLAQMLNAPAAYEDWMGFINGVLDRLHEHPYDDYLQSHFRREAKRRGKIGILRWRQAMTCWERNLNCANLYPDFYYTGDADFYTEPHHGTD